MNSPTTEPQWNGNKRRDGLTIELGTGGFVIMTANRASSLTLCPCCDKPLETERAARLVADLVYPVGREH